MLADNRNDAVLSVGALVALILTQLSSQLWWVDAAAALLDVEDTSSRASANLALPPPRVK